MQEKRFAGINNQIRFWSAAVWMACLLFFESAVVQAASKSIFTTELTGEGQDVTFQIKIAGNTKVTSGRIKIYYPAELLKVSDVQSGISWEVTDTDTALEEDGRRGISYAWADTKELAGEGELLTVMMEAAEQAVGQEIVVETEIVELFSREEAVEPGEYRISDRLKIASGEGGVPTDPEPADPEPADSGTAGTIVPGAGVSSVHTGDEADPAGYALLCMCSLMALIDLIRKERS